jgi:hypothetical protein
MPTMTGCVPFPSINDLKFVVVNWPHLANNLLRHIEECNGIVESTEQYKLNDRQDAVSKTLRWPHLLEQNATSDETFVESSDRTK